MKKYILNLINKFRKIKPNKMAKKKRVYTEEQIKQELANLLTKRETDCPYISASIVNENEQPLILSSDEKFEQHYINFGNGMIMGVPSKMLPYLINSLSELYHRNLDAHAKGDKKLMSDIDTSIQANMDIEYFDVTGIEPEEHIKELRERRDKLNDILKKQANGELADLSDEDKAEILQQLEISAEIAQDTMEKLKKGGLSQKEQTELKKEANKELQKHMDEVESVLLGRRKNDVKEIDLEHIKVIFSKYGQQAAVEEINRLPVEKRDEILQEMLEYFKNKKQ